MFLSLNLVSKELFLLPFEELTLKQIIDIMEFLKLDWYNWKVKKQNFYPEKRHIIKLSKETKEFPWSKEYPLAKKDDDISFDKGGKDYQIVFFIEI